MSTTAQWVFDKAIYLMDEQNQSNGATETGDTLDYRHRTLGILNILRHALYPISDTYAVEEPGRRPICPELTGFADEIGLDDAVAQGILPYGLAGHLLLGENDGMAAWFFQRYDELCRAYRAALPAKWEPIPLAYGGPEGKGGDAWQS